MRKRKLLRSERSRQHFVVDHVVPYIQHMSSTEVKNVAFEPKLHEQEVSNSLAMIVVRQAGRLDELAKYKKLIRDAVNDNFSSWERELASELQCIATAIIISDLVGEKFIGDETAYDFAGKEIVVTDSLVEMVSHTWNQRTSFDIPLARV